MFKAELRKISQQKRLSMTDDEYQLACKQLLHHFSQLDFSAISTIHIFLPITEKKEPDTFLFIGWLQQNHPRIKIIVPKADFETALMSHHEYLGKHDLQKSLFNILEPQSGATHNGIADLIIIPLLAFDLNGYRVGYGKGFYDRFLSHSNAQKFGLSLFPPAEKIDDVNEHDIRLDFCITPSGILKF